MASKRKSTKKATKKTSSAKRHYPVVRGSFLGSADEDTIVRTLDVPRALSLLNRRLYRYARVYPVNISMVPTEAQTVEVYALRDDWAVHQGIKLAYKAYTMNTSEEREMLNGKTARWEDFRVNDGVAGNAMLPKLMSNNFIGAGQLLTGGQFNLSSVVDQGNNTMTFTWGASVANTSYGILAEYNKTGNAQASPEGETLFAPYENLTTQVNEQTHLDLQRDGKEPPYDADGVNTATPFVKIATLGAGAAGQQKLSTGYFNAPCGIVVMVGSGASWNSDAMSFEVQKGDYKGVGGRSLLE